MADLDVLGEPLRKSQEASAAARKKAAEVKASAEKKRKDEAAKKAAAEKAAAEKKRKEEEAGRAEAKQKRDADAASRKAKAERDAVFDRQIGALEAEARKYPIDSPQWVSAQSKIKDLERRKSDPQAAVPNPSDLLIGGQPTVVSQPSAPTLASAATVGKSAWNRAVNPPAFTYPAGFTVGEAVYYGAESTSMRGMRPGATNLEGQYSYTDKIITKDDAVAQFTNLGKSDRDALIGFANDMGISAESAWETAVSQSAYLLRFGVKMTPMAALSKFVDDGKKSGSFGSGGGATTSTDYNLSSESDARLLVDNALQGHLGRKATKQEEDNFYAALLKAQRQNPTVTSRSGGANSTNTTRQGLNASQFAEEWGAAQQGAGEYAAATTYLDAFLGSLTNPVNVAGV